MLTALAALEAPLVKARRSSSHAVIDTRYSLRPCCFHLGCRRRTAYCRRRRQKSQACAGNAIGGAHLPSQKVVGLGLACWDFLAQLEAFPKPDQKLRTQRLEVRSSHALLLAASCLSGGYLVGKRWRQLCQCIDSSCPAWFGSTFDHQSWGRQYRATDCLRACW